MDVGRVVVAAHLAREEVELHVLEELLDGFVEVRELRRIGQHVAVSLFGRRRAALTRSGAGRFLAPYRVHRIVTTYDAAGWRPSASDIERYGSDIPDRVYSTTDFERIVALRARTETIARHLTEFLKSTDRFAKTIVFCVDQEHADEMRRALGNLNADLVHPAPASVSDAVRVGGVAPLGRSSD